MLHVDRCLYLIYNKALLYRNQNKPNAISSVLTAAN
jgi:hypothetical protein